MKQPLSIVLDQVNGRTPGGRGWGEGGLRVAFPVMGQPDSGDTAWMLASSALVLLMTPGLAFFYGGMVRAKSVLNMLMMSFSALGVVGILWVLYGYSMFFGNDILGTDYGGLLGDPTQYWGLKDLMGGTWLASGDTLAHIAVVNGVDGKIGG